MMARLTDDGVEGEEEGEDGAVVDGVLAAADGEVAVVALHDLVVTQRPRPVPLRSLVV